MIIPMEFSWHMCRVNPRGSELTGLVPFKGHAHLHRGVVGNTDVVEELVVAVLDSLPEGDEKSWWRRVLRLIFFYCLPILPLAYFLIWWLGYI